MFKSIDSVLICTENNKSLDKMVGFYEKTLGFKRCGELNLPNDTCVGFEFSGNPVQLWILVHSEVKGNSKEAPRHLLNFEVDSVEKVYKELESKGVNFITKPFEAPTGKSYFATFTDPEGNYLQLWSRNK